MEEKGPVDVKLALLAFFFNAKDGDGNAGQGK